jgi:type III secretory pathway component EscU
MEDIFEYKEDRFIIKIVNGIVQIEWLVSFIDYDFINDIINKRLEITKDKTYPMFTDMRKVKSGTRQARERLASSDSAFGVAAGAILVSTKVHVIMYRFFNTIYKSPVPAKLFTDKDKALQWLEQYK